MWKIGSGDVFSAAFAINGLRRGQRFWMLLVFASRMVAEYVSTRMEVFDADQMKRIRAEAAEAEVTADRPIRRPMRESIRGAVFYHSTAVAR